jgi:hypothetical protein
MEKKIMVRISSPGLTINPLGNSSLNSNLITFKPSPNPSSRQIELVLPEAYQTKKSKKSNSLPLNYPENVTAGQSPKSTIRRKYLYDIGLTFDPISSSSTISSLSGLFATSDFAAEAATESLVYTHTLNVTHWYFIISITITIFAIFI